MRDDQGTGKRGDSAAFGRRYGAKLQAWANDLGSLVAVSGSPQPASATENKPMAKAPLMAFPCASAAPYTFE